jgi:hypothetical protein
VFELKVNPYTLAPPFASLAVFTHTHTQKLYNPQPFHDEEDEYSLGVAEDGSMRVKLSLRMSREVVEVIDAFTGQTS